MEPNNLELEIKKKLIVEQSSLALAWDRLEAMLDNAEKTKVFAVDLGFISQLVLFYFGYNFFKIETNTTLKKCSVHWNNKR
jgi:hypothetical protein